MTIFWLTNWQSHGEIQNLTKKVETLKVDVTIYVKEIQVWFGKIESASVTVPSLVKFQAVPMIFFRDKRSFSIHFNRLDYNSQASSALTTLTYQNFLSSKSQKRNLKRIHSQHSMTSFYDEVRFKCSSGTAACSDSLPIHSRTLIGVTDLFCS